MHAVVLELTQHIVHLFRFRHKIRGADKTLPPERVRLVDVHQQVLDIEHSLDVVGIALVYGDAAVVVVHHAFHHLRERCIYVYVHHILAAGHNLLNCLVAHADDTLKHTLLVPYRLVVGKFESLSKLINAQHMTILVQHVLHHHAATEKQRLYGPEKFSDEHHSAYHAPAKGQRVLTGEDLWHYFAEKQEQEGKQHRDAKEFQPICVAEIYQFAEHIVAEHDYGDVHEIVCHKNGGKRALAVFTQNIYVCVLCIVLRVHLVKVRRRKTEKSYLRTARKSRYAEQNHDEGCGETNVPCGFPERNLLYRPFYKRNTQFINILH